MQQPILSKQLGSWYLAVRSNIHCLTLVNCKYTPKTVNRHEMTSNEPCPSIQFDNRCLWCNISMAGQNDTWSLKPKIALFNFLDSFWFLWYLIWPYTTKTSHQQQAVAFVIGHYNYDLLSLINLMWDLIVSVPDHCLSFYFTSETLRYNTGYLNERLRVKKTNLYSAFFLWLA